MFKFIEKTDVKNIPVVTTILNTLSTLFDFLLISTLIYFIDFNWNLLPIALIGVASFAFTIYKQDIKLLEEKTIKSRNYKIFSFKFLGFCIYSFLFMHLCLKANLDANIKIIAIFSCVFSFLRLFVQDSISESIIKITKDKENFETAKKIFNQFFIITISSLMTLILQWVCIYNVADSLNILNWLIIYAIVAVLIQSILLNLSTKLREKLIQ